MVAGDIGTEGHAEGWEAETSPEWVHLYGRSGDLLLRPIRKCKQLSTVLLPIVNVPR